MYDEDDDKRFPRITLWQFSNGVLSHLFLATGWLASFGSGLWSFIIGSTWVEYLDAKLKKKERVPADNERSPLNEKGPLKGP